MDFTLSDEQKALAESVGRYLDKEYSFTVRQGAVEAGGYSPAAWQAFANLGWLAISLPEKDGGLGGSAIDVMNIMTQIGRHLVVEPFLSTVVMGTLFIREGRPPEAAALLEQIIMGELHVAVALHEGQYDVEQIATSAIQSGDGYSLSGFKPLVINAAIAEKLIIPARLDGSGEAPLALLLIDRDAPGVTIEPFRTHDGRNAGSVRLEGVIVNQSAILAGGAELLDAVIAHAAAAQCADSVGAAEALVETTAGYMKEREQFGSKLAEFQVVQHALVDMYVALETSRSMAFVAARLVEDWDPRQWAGLSAASFKIAEATTAIAQSAVQLHGGMGVSEDYHVGHYYKRIKTNAALLGDASHWLKRYLAATAPELPSAAAAQHETQGETVV